ncbi:uncharacterized protein VP01_1604g8 [Puccinia sorghi]|uniref:Uncharacterized protein n=1 Tax=Puccinia sorghi TaxID=27349 RepID=A0A0L6VHU9_9BASI|nr:uncharacterized protein VP01_1604g8 [Puccinia sorghi]
MEKVIRCVDQAAFLRAKTPQKKMYLRGLLEHNNTQDPTNEEAEAQTVPQRFPQDGYSPKYLKAVGDFHAEHLSSEAMGLEDLCTEMVNNTFGKNGIIDFNGALQAPQAGPSMSSGPKVQVSS